MNEQEITNYFLGKLSQSESELFEEKIALDAELSELSQIIEDELIDDYVREGLSSSDRELFEANYLTTEDRYLKLRLSRGLRKIANERVSKVPIVPNSVSFWQMLKTWQIAFGCLAGILLIGTIYFYLFKFKEKPEIAMEQNINQPVPEKTVTQGTPSIENTENANVNNVNVNVSTVKNSSPNKNTIQNAENKLTPTPTPKVVEQAPQLAASFILLPETLRSDGEQFIKISPKVKKVNLRLTLPKDAGKYQSYSVSLKTADGVMVLNWTNLKSLNLDIAVERLENRTYLIFLEGQNGQNPAESITEYTFRVER